MCIRDRYTKTEIRKLILAGFIQGYECGHDDTVESSYTDSEERGFDWLNEAEKDGGLAYTVRQITIISDEPKGEI